MVQASTTTNFEKGFPLSLNRFEKPMQIIEDTLFIRACQMGILEVEVFDTDFSPQQALRSNVLMPVLVDYVTHVFGRTLQWQFQSSLHDQVMMEILENHDNSQPIAELMNTVSDKVNRPALYNKADPKSLLQARSSLREASGIPLSVTLLMMDMALETAHEMSMAYQLELVEDRREEVLDLTPVVRLLRSVEAQPRVEVPETLNSDSLHRDSAAEALAETVFQSKSLNQDQRD